MATTPEGVEARTGVSGAQAGFIVAGLVVVLGLLWFIFLRGGPAEPVALVPPVTTPAPVPEVTEKPGKAGKGPLETFEVFAPKDPFKPLISLNDGGAVAAPAVEPGTTGGTTTGGGNAPSGGSDISGDGSGSGGSDVGGRRVRVIDTFRSGGEVRARIQVDGTVYTVSEGDRFADNFEVLSISGSCTSLLFGDDQFTLCEGEEILK
jgi:hypothetical protein